MEWIEIIQLRSYNSRDKEKALDAFRQLSLSTPEPRFKEITLFRNAFVENDLLIFIRWNGERPDSGKSPLGLQLAAAFSEFGQIHHTVWSHDAKIMWKKENAI